MQLEQCFGEVLRAVRKERGLSQEQLAGDAELERNFVSLIELGRSSPSLRTIFKLCKALGVAPSALIARVEEQMRSGAKKRQSKR